VGLSYEEEALWKYQRYMEDYLRCVASVDDNVGRVIDWLRARGEFDDTLLIYSSNQGFFLGDHGWFACTDKCTYIRQESTLLYS
jgi:arylsulfatase A-like enzyme